jgi:uncharacterized membrane protein
MCCVMTALRLISLPLHGALEMLVGFLVMAAPVALHLSPAAGVVGIVVGTLIVGLALSSTGAEADGRRPLTIAAHHAFDYGLVTGLLGAAAVLGLAGDRRATVLFAAAALIQLSLNLTTRYSHR